MCSPQNKVRDSHPAGDIQIRNGVSMKLKMVCSLALPTVFLLTLLGCWPPHEPAKPNLPSPPGASASLQQGADAQHWFENYYPADTPVQPVTFQQKYDGDFLAQGMADPVDAAY